MNTTKKQVYKAPIIETVNLDFAISLQLESTQSEKDPSGEPQWSYGTDNFNNEPLGWGEN